MIIANSDHPQEELKMPPLPPKGDSGSRQHDVDTLPPPPPYSPPPGPSNVAPLPPPSPSTPSSIFRPQEAQTVNHFELFSKHDTIAGTYLVDPQLPSMIAGISKKLRRRRAGVWGKHASRSGADLNAAFRTRHGHISLDVAIVARGAGPTPSPDPGAPKVPGRVLVSSRHGRISVDVHEVHAGRSLDLEVESRHGRITVLLPPTFDGPLVVQSCNGGAGAVSLLPAFAARARTIRATDRETVMYCSPPSSSSSPSSSSQMPLKPLGQMADDDGDRCLVRTRHGRIVVGVSGLDRVEEQPGGAGLFRSLGRLFEVQGRALGQYVETRARMLEKSVQGGGAFAQYLDERLEQGGPQPRWQAHQAGRRY